jgi:hypothetical protein
MLDRAGTQHQLTLSVGIPEERDPDEWACKLTVTGPELTGGWVSGADGFQALSLALRYARSQLEALVERGAQLGIAVAPGEGPVWDSPAVIEAYFGGLAGFGRVVAPPAQ